MEDGMKRETKGRGAGAAARYAALLILAGMIWSPWPVNAVAAEVVITVKGTVAPDSFDDDGIFKVGRELKGQPFTLTITFDASKAEERNNEGCVSSSVKGSTASGSPARAVLKIGAGSYVFGTKPESRWEAWRDAPSGCDVTGGVSFSVFEGTYPQTTILRMPMHPDGKKLSASVDWNLAIPTTKIGTVEQFVISHPGDSEHQVRGRLMATSMTLTSGGQVDEKADATASEEADKTNNPKQPSSPDGIKDRLKHGVDNILKRLPQMSPAHQ
jgi:hypothetical protein